jgi:hypothetical protein
MRPWLVAGGIFLLPVVYLASFAPLLALDSRGMLPEACETAVEYYATPVRLSYDHGPEWWRHFLDRYADLCGSH